MNYLSLGKTLVQAFFFRRNLVRDFGEPVHWSQQEAARFFRSLEDNPMLTNRFVIAIGMKSNAPIFLKNVEQYLDFSGEFSSEKYLWAVHKDYLEPYLKWNQAITLYAGSIKDYLAPMQQTFRLAFPLKLKRLGYHWVLQESFPLQLDEHKNMVSYLNIYTPIRPFDPKEKIPLVGDLWDNNHRNENWTQGLWKTFFTARQFILSPAQRSIVDLLLQQPELTNAQIAEQLGKQKNTVDVQNKQILARARECFPMQRFDTVRDVAALLAELAFFEREFSANDTGHGNQLPEGW